MNKMTEKFKGILAHRDFFLLYLLPCMIFFSTIFWMRNSVDYAGWSLVEAAIAVRLIILLLKKDTISFPSRSVFLPLLILALWSACSLLWSCNLHATLTGSYKIFALILAMVLFMNEPDQWIRAIQYTVIILCSLSSLIYITATTASLTWLTHSGLFNGFLALGSILCIGIALTSKGIKQWIIMSAAILSAMTIFLTGSAGPVLCWMTGTFLQLLFHNRRKVWILGLFVLALFLISFALHIHHRNKAARGENVRPFSNILLRKLEDRYHLERIQIWKDSANYFLHHPFIGTGMGTFRDVYPEFKQIEGLRNAPYAHNEILNILCELGLAGGIILMGFIWGLCRTLWREKERWKEHGTWFAVALAVFIQSLFDFNLRYPPVLLLFIFAISRIISSHNEIRIMQRKQRIISALTLFIFGILFSLPGIADLIFKKHYPDAQKRREAALTAIRLDPFNGLYHAESGRMRNVMLAIDLEPRNVWYRREAARFFLREWEKNRQDAEMQSAMEQYREILHYAPNVAQFQDEAKNIYILASEYKKKRNQSVRD